MLFHEKSTTDTSQLNPAIAKAAKNNEVKQTNRFSLEAGLGSNFSLLYPNIAVSYRLPLVSDRVEVFASYFSSSTQNMGIGSRFYFVTEGLFHPYVEARAGVGFLSAPPNITSSVYGYAGGGVDFMFDNNWGVTVRVLGGANSSANRLEFLSEMGLKYILKKKAASRR